MNQLIVQIRKDLKANVDEQTKKSCPRFFKEEVTCYGVKTPMVGKIAGKYWGQVELLSKKEIFGLCEILFGSDYIEEAFVVSKWLPRMEGRFEIEDLATFKVWIEKYLNNWAKCDSFCNHTLAGFVMKYPQLIGEIVGWSKNSNRWLKRASAVSLILPARAGHFLPEAFEICDVLLLDNDDMVQKGYGWLLKEASRQHTQEVFDYVMKNRRVMPRTALRYAIELMPKELRVEAMKKD